MPSPLLPTALLTLVTSMTAAHAQPTSDADRLPWPEGVASNEHDAFIRTPRPTRAPRINGPRVFGATPGNPIRYKVPASGEKPIRYNADLPRGLAIDHDTGVITGSLQAPGDNPVTVRATNALGTDEATIVFRIGDAIGLTPPMGWNSWNSWGWKVTQENVRDSAHAMVDTGLIDHGWTFVNIDDTWQGARGGAYNALQPNERFPDMKGLMDEIHALGLKAGIYSTPWISSYARYPGASSDNPRGEWDQSLRDEKRVGVYSFVRQDAKQWADWGVDYLKYDWHPNDPEHTGGMALALRTTGRDIVFSLSNSAPFEYADELSSLCQLARTTGDIRDQWVKSDRYEEWTWGLRDIWDGHERWRPFSRPGFFADADMLVVGNVGWDGTLHPTALTPDEQYTHITLWTLWASPLLLGCPLERLDRFTLSLLTNDEVIAVNQDELGLMARTVSEDGTRYVLRKKLADGSVAVGLFNRGDTPADVSARFADLGISGAHTVRDVWRQKDLGTATDAFRATVAPHGGELFRLRATTPPPPTGAGLSALTDDRSLLRNGDRIVFFGDSITHEGSYINLIRQHVEQARPGLSVEFVNKGIGGHRVPDLQARFQRDVLDLKPTMVVIYIGINDVWHWAANPPRGTPRDEYEAGLRQMIGDCQKAGIRVVLCSPSVIGERPRGDNPFDARLNQYAAISASLAREFEIPFCDLRSAFFDALRGLNPDGKDRGVTTTDGVHMLPEGSQILADHIAPAMAEGLRGR